MTDPQNQTTRLSAAQQALLMEMQRSNGVTTVDYSYRPAIRLTALGLAKFEPQRFGGWRIRLTDAGVRRAKEGETTNVAG